MTGSGIVHDLLADGSMMSDEGVGGAGTRTQTVCVGYTDPAMLGNATVVDGRVVRRPREVAVANAAFVVGVAPR
ncbi:MAG: hypothetical protein ACKVIY_02505 [Acidimicrobiales bacterium]